MDLVLETAALAHQLLATLQPPAQSAGGLVGQPGALQQAGRQQLGQGARVAAVGLGLGAGDRVQLLGAGHHHTARARRQDVGDGQGVAGRLQGHLVVGAQALGQQLELLGGRGHAARRA